MALTDQQLLLLDNLIYLDVVRDGSTVGDIAQYALDRIDALTANSPAGMSKSEWVALLNAIKKDPTLMSYTVKNYIDENTGMRAACFVKGNDVNVVFRGTAGEDQWRDNGQGGFLSDTDQQNRAAQYINGLPKEYGDSITVTGHSKGGNIAQYVTIVTDRIARCLSYDGQGFSPEFLKKYAKEIAERSGLITSISAAGDIVNSLLNKIAGTTIYIDDAKQGDLLNSHKPNAIFDRYFNLLPETSRSALAALVNKFTVFAVSYLPDPIRGFVVDGLMDEIIALADGKANSHMVQTVISAVITFSVLDDFAFNFGAKNFGIGVGLILQQIVKFLQAVVMALVIIAIVLVAIGAVVVLIAKLVEFVVKTLQKFAKWLAHQVYEITKAALKLGKKVAKEVLVVLAFVVANIQAFINRVRAWCVDLLEKIARGWNKFKNAFAGVTSERIVLSYSAASNAKTQLERARLRIQDADEDLRKARAQLSSAGSVVSGAFFFSSIPSISAAGLNNSINYFQLVGDKFKEADASAKQKLAKG